MAAERDDTPSLVKMLLTWRATVFSLRKSCSAMARLVRPDAIRDAAALIPGAELLMFEDAAHEILREKDAIRLEAFAAIDSFLDRHAHQ